MFRRRLFAQSAGSSEDLLGETKKPYTKENVMRRKKKFFLCSIKIRQLRFMIETIGGQITGTQWIMDEITIGQDRFLSSLEN